MKELIERWLDVSFQRIEKLERSLDQLTVQMERLIDGIRTDKSKLAMEALIGGIS